MGAHPLRPSLSLPIHGFGERRSGSSISAAYSAPSNSLTEISRSSAQTSGERPTRIRRTKQYRKSGCSIKRRRSSGGRPSTSQGPSDDFVHRRTADLTASVRRPRGEKSSPAPMPYITAASAVFMPPVRSKAVRKAISSASGIVSITKKLHACRQNRAMPLNAPHSHVHSPCGVLG